MGPADEYHYAAKNTVTMNLIIVLESGYYLFAAYHGNSRVLLVRLDSYLSLR